MKLKHSLAPPPTNCLHIRIKVYQVDSKKYIICRQHQTKNFKIQNEIITDSKCMVLLNSSSVAYTSTHLQNSKTTLANHHSPEARRVLTTQNGEEQQQQAPISPQDLHMLFVRKVQTLDHVQSGRCQCICHPPKYLHLCHLNRSI